MFLFFVVNAIFANNVEGYLCETSLKSGTSNYGPGISQEAVDDSSPFVTGDYNAIVAFDETHCIEMCCEQEECYVAVFDQVEAMCYLKAMEALGSSHEEDVEDVSSYVIEERSGEYKGVDFTPSNCSSKRGVAYGFNDTAALLTLQDGLSWWYDWTPGVIEDDILEASFDQGSFYVPMIWGEDDLTEARLSYLSRVGDSSSYILGFNEPNYDSQAKLTAQEAAQLWSQVRVLAEEYDVDLVSPAVNYCSGDCIEDDPIQWLDDFFVECGNINGGCGIKYLAIHSYVCEVQYLNKNIHSYTKYGLPIWLTEFACAFEVEVTEASEFSQAEYLSGALTYLELNPHIFRYAWFTAVSSASDGVDNSDLLDSSTGQLTAVGEVFVTEYADLQRCGDKDMVIGNGESSLAVSDETFYRAEAEPVIDIEAETESSTPESTIMPEPAVILDVHPEAEEINNVVIKNVGGSGFFDNVINIIEGEDMFCTSFVDACVKEEICVSGDLAPFDEVSVAFRGPLNLHNIVWYEGSAHGVLNRTSSWAPGSMEDNLIFMKNLGGHSKCAGEWSICGGNSQSYADASGNSCTSDKTSFLGRLSDDAEVNIMTSWECASISQCGFYRDVGMRGWTGGEDGTKVMIFEVDMPHCGETCTWDRPGVWALNARVLRTAQYGCNCRGVGGNGGCGEFNILGAVIGHPYSDMLFSQVYDFKGAGGPGPFKYFKRPLEKTTYAAVFRGGWDSYLQVVELESWIFDKKTLSTETLDAIKGNTSFEIYDVNSRQAPHGCPNDLSEIMIELSEADGYEYMGCFNTMELVTARDVQTTKRLEGNTAYMCATLCNTIEGTVFFGLHDGEMCWCGGLSDLETGMDGEEKCDMPCPGEEAVACGGTMASSVYVLPVDHFYVGCFADARGDRDMLLVPKVMNDCLTPAVCAAYCSFVDNAIFFGVQAGEECFCGDSFGRHGNSSACHEPCKGDSNQVCGAHHVNSIYTLRQPDEASSYGV